MAAVKFFFSSYLKEMLPKKYGGEPFFLHQFDRKASIKDVIESLGIPHPIVGKLTVNSRNVGFDYILLHNDTVEVDPLMPPHNPLMPSILRPETLEGFAFVADANVGKLALFMRMLGFDTVYAKHYKDRKLADIAQSQKRILLTRDTSLLKRKIVMHGYLPRSNDPFYQVVEVVRLYDLRSRIEPLSRCIPCNGRLVPVNKETVIDRLEPLTRKYYDTFHLCGRCNKVYWPGSHQEKIRVIVGEIIETAYTAGSHGL